MEFFEPMLKYVDGSLAEGKNVLIHCWAGAHRAGTTSVAYMMHKHRADYKTVLTAAKTCRSASRLKLRKNWCKCSLFLKMHSKMITFWMKMLTSNTLVMIALRKNVLLRNWNISRRWALKKTLRLLHWYTQIFEMQFYHNDFVYHWYTQILYLKCNSTTMILFIDTICIILIES